MGLHIKVATQVRVILQVLIFISGAWWLLFWFLQPITTSKTWLTSIDTKITSKFLGFRGSVFMLQALPMIIITLLSYFMLELQRRTRLSTSTKVQVAHKKPKVNIWTLPIIVRGPLGMLTLGDILFILVILFTVFWFLIKSSTNVSKAIDMNLLESRGDPKWVQKTHAIGGLLGKTALIPMALLWVPVARGSPILKIIGVPFERALKYHIWLGFLTVLLLIGHGICFTIHFPSIPMILPGLIAIVAGILMMITGLEKIRRKYFDFFFTMHHLYLVFLLGFAFHEIKFMYYIIIPVLLFFMDRFMRLVQSRKAVDVLSAKVLRCGTMELKFAKPASSTYHPLDFIYMRLPSISRVQWHPFSVASSPLDGTNQITVYIKPLGGFTKQLHDALIQSKKSDNEGREVFKCPFSFKVGVEGPYGSESGFYLKHKSLVMVAGGIGVTPFLAILRDILHRYKLRQEGLPSSIELIHCVKNRSELHILDTLALDSILPGYEDYVNIKVHAYVTRPQDNTQDPEANITATDDLTYANFHKDSVDVLSSTSASIEAASKMSTIGSTGHTAWVAATIVMTLLGFFLVAGIFNDTVLKNNDETIYAPTRPVLLRVASILIAVVVFGGGMMLLWASSRAIKARNLMSQLFTSSSPTHDGTHELQEMQDSMERGGSPVVPDESLWKDNLNTGTRPNWVDIFRELTNKKAGEDVGVMVSGGHGMQQDVADQCRHHSLCSSESTAVFHYQSVSFEL